MYVRYWETLTVISSEKFKRLSLDILPLYGRFAEGPLNAENKPANCLGCA